MLPSPQGPNAVPGTAQAVIKSDRDLSTLSVCINGSADGAATGEPACGSILAEKKEDGVLLTVRTGEAAERVSCRSADVRGRSELFLRLETAGNAFPELSYGDR